MFCKQYIAYFSFALLIALTIFIVLIGQKHDTGTKTLTENSEEKEKMIDSVEVYSLYNNLVEKYSQLKSINEEDFILIIYSLRYIAFIPEKDLRYFFRAIVEHNWESERRLKQTDIEVRKELDRYIKTVDEFIEHAESLKNIFFSDSENSVSFFDQHLTFLLKYKIDNYKIIFDEKIGRFDDEFCDVFNKLPKVADLFPKDEEMEKVFEKKYATNLTNTEYSTFNFVFLSMWDDNLSRVEISN
ncbi:hypothetical protein NCER_101784 [Vairimorpha ceranae BRL01]|uniref:Uncharacterized protein n=2 Tax=Vairimorpha ceranae TaxID=40302 RepID=C4VAR3_VAIC1|nr:hypothetical protein AAJ76_900093614 [Vairimorpha ceranae]EEQ81689.1 hypothetical protein NCER_101784 [Vairimorpha ceranae BRL01]KAF5141145.1 hypothetical protein G9O61_00g004610 [Vairimorpha ceranae]KKO75963.1 hypothetical protein AAJ76_900093614 [Vairimorpha ceranae]